MIVYQLIDYLLAQAVNVQCISRRKMQRSRDLRCAAQFRPPMHWYADWSTSRVPLVFDRIVLRTFSTFDLQIGQYSGISKWSRFSRGPFSATSMTSGITSPALRTTTLSLRQKALARFALCKVAFATVVPPTNTGSRRATGVMAPVRPTCTSMSSSTVVACSAGNLCARANRGERETNPSCSCKLRRLTL